MPKVQPIANGLGPCTTLTTYSRFYFSFRFLVAIIGFFGYMIKYIQKIDISIGILWFVICFKMIKKEINKRF